MGVEGVRKGDPAGLRVSQGHHQRVPEAPRQGPPHPRQAGRAERKEGLQKRYAKVRLSALPARIEGIKELPFRRNYWAALRESGVVDDDFTKFIASDDVQHPSYQQLLFADLRAYGVTENLNLRVTTSFEGTSVCPSNLYLVSCFVTEASLMKASDGEWSLDRVIGKKK